MVVCLLQSSGIQSAQNPSQQSWSDWLWSKFTPAQQKRIVQIKEAAPKIALGSYAAYELGPPLASTFEYEGMVRSYSPLLEVFGVTNPDIAYVTGSVTTVTIFAFTFFVLREIYNGLERDRVRLESERQKQELERQRLVAIEQTKNVLIWLLGNVVLYPTRQSRLDALEQKDDFLKNAANALNDKTILSEACTQLMDEINRIPYSDEQKKADREIDKYMSKISRITKSPSLDVQMAELNLMRKQPMEIDEMRAYLSFYYRIKNQLDFEKGLTSEQKEQFSNISKSLGQRMEQQKTMKEQEIQRLLQEKGKERKFVAPVNPAVQKENQ